MDRLGAFLTGYTPSAYRSEQSAPWTMSKEMRQLFYSWSSASEPTIVSFLQLTEIDPEELSKKVFCYIHNEETKLLKVRVNCLSDQRIVLKFNSALTDLIHGMSHE